MIAMYLILQAVTCHITQIPNYGVWQIAASKTEHWYILTKHKFKNKDMK